MDRNFLNIGEIGILVIGFKKGVYCFFIVSEGNVYVVELRDWVNGLVLVKGWCKVIDEEVFKIGEKYFFWFFCLRNNEDKFCFILVKFD